jgi:hypothetical protein
MPGLDHHEINKISNNKKINIYFHYVFSDIQCVSKERYNLESSYKFTRGHIHIQTVIT